MPVKILHLCIMLAVKMHLFISVVNITQIALYLCPYVFIYKYTTVQKFDLVLKKHFSLSQFKIFERLNIFLWKP